MRVISGIYKGRNISGFDIDGTRPTMDRVKESMFASIQNNIKDKIVLDLFSGSGSLGIESLSNGAKMCYFVDNNKIAINTIKKNTIDILNKVILNNDYLTALEYFKNNDIRFDLILLDPPYKNDLLNNSIKYIEEYNLLNEGGILVCEFEIDKIQTKYKLIKSKKYGLKYVNIYKN
jgi:16S rRNA (guanine(966)-N(2))-methyltransferase RsmD